MSRTKTGFVTKKRHKKIIRFNKGFKASHSRLFKTANQENMKSLTYAYADRRKKKSQFRRIWIKQINNTTKLTLSNYSKFIKFLKISKIQLNRKVLSKLSIIDSNVFKSLVNNK